MRATPGLQAVGADESATHRPVLLLDVAAKAIWSHLARRPARCPARHGLGAARDGIQQILTVIFWRGSHVNGHGACRMAGMTRLLAVLVASVGLLTTAMTPAAAQTAACPLISDADVSRAVGSQVSVPSFYIVDSGSSVQCLFQGDAVGAGVLVGRYPNFFAPEDVQPFGPDQPRLRTLLPDGLPSSAALTLAPVDGLGLGDMAVWVTPVDPSIAPDTLGRLLFKRGADAFVVGVADGPGAIAIATAVAQPLLQ